MPTLIFLALAYQIQNIKWRYAFLVLAALNLIFNICTHAALQEFYSATMIVLLFMLNPYFLSWWRKRNSRNNPTSFWQFLTETYLIVKHNKLRVFLWVSALIISIVGVIFFVRFTDYFLLGWLVAIFLVIYIVKKLFYSMMPPEWFLHDINTGYVFLSVLISWSVAYLMKIELGTNFVTPMTLAVIFCLFGFYRVHRSTRFLVPGCAVILSDIVWQIIRFVQTDIGYTPQTLTAEGVLLLVMIVGLIWLIKKPGILPITYLSLFQLFRFSTFVYEAIYRATSNDLAAVDVTYYILYLVCWMYIVPLLFWFIGLRQEDLKTTQNIAKDKTRPNKFFESFKKNQANG